MASSIYGSRDLFMRTYSTFSSHRMIRTWLGGMTEWTFIGVGWGVCSMTSCFYDPPSLWVNDHLLEVITIDL